MISFSPNIIIDLEINRFLKAKVNHDSLLNISLKLFDLIENYNCRTIGHTDSLDNSPPPPSQESAILVTDYNIIILSEKEIDSFCNKHKFTNCNSIIIRIENDLQTKIKEWSEDSIDNGNIFSELEQNLLASWKEYFVAEGSKNKLFYVHHIKNESDGKNDFNMLINHSRLSNKIIIHDKYILNYIKCKTSEYNISILISELLRMNSFEEEIKIYLYSAWNREGGAKIIENREELTELLEGIKKNITLNGKKLMKQQNKKIEISCCLFPPSIYTEHDRFVMLSNVSIFSGKGFVLYKKDNSPYDTDGVNFFVVENVNSDNIKFNKSIKDRLEKMEGEAEVLGKRSYLKSTI